MIFSFCTAGWARDLYNLEHRKFSDLFFWNRLEIKHVFFHPKSSYTYWSLHFTKIDIYCFLLSTSQKCSRNHKRVLLLSSFVPQAKERKLRKYRGAVCIEYLFIFFHISPLLAQCGRDLFHYCHWQMLLFVEHPLVLVFRDVGHHWLFVCLITVLEILAGFLQWRPTSQLILII